MNSFVMITWKMICMYIFETTFNIIKHNHEIFTQTMRVINSKHRNCADIFFYFWKMKWVVFFKRNDFLIFKLLTHSWRIFFINFDWNFVFVFSCREDPIDEVFEEEPSHLKILSEVVPIRTAPTKRKTNVILVPSPGYVVLFFVKCSLLLPNLLLALFPKNIFCCILYSIFYFIQTKLQSSIA